MRPDSGLARHELEYLEQARGRAEELKKSFDSGKLQSTEKDLIPFVYV